MPSTEDFIVRNMTLYSVLGLALRFILYGIPLLDLVWLYVVLSFLVGIGGTSLALGREFNRTNYLVLGVFLVILGLLPLQWLF